jgi:MFS family permease
MDSADDSSAPPSPEEPSTLLPSPTILGLMVSTIVLACSLSMISALENEFNERLSQTALGFGVAFSALTVSRLFVQIPIGRLSDRIGRKGIIIGGLLALAPLTVLFGYVTTTGQLISLRVLQGVATAGVAAPAFALAGDLARKGGEGREMSFVTMGFGLGMGLGPLLAGGLAGYVGFKVPFYVVGGFALVAAAWVWRWAEESIAPGEWALDEV